MEGYNSVKASDNEDFPANGGHLRMPENVRLISGPVMEQDLTCRRTFEGMSQDEQERPHHKKAKLEPSISNLQASTLTDSDHPYSKPTDNTSVSNTQTQVIELIILPESQAHDSRHVNARPPQNTVSSESMPSNQSHINSKSESKKGSLFESLQVDVTHIRNYLVRDPYIRFDQKKGTYVLSLYTKQGWTRNKCFPDLNSISLFLVAEEIWDFLNTPSRQRSKNQEFNSLLCDSLKKTCPTIASTRVSFFQGKAIVTATFEDGTIKKKYFPGVTNSDELLVEIDRFTKSESFDFLSFTNIQWTILQTVQQGNDTLYMVENMCPFDIRKYFNFCRCHAKDISFTRERNTLLISCIENEKWGTTHRLNDTFKLSTECDPHVFLRIEIKCSSNTAECRSDCGALLSSITCDGGVCSNCSYKFRQCCNCRSYAKSEYEVYEARTYCQACLKHLKTMGTERTILEYRETSPKYANHLRCKWGLKLELHSNDQNKFTVMEKYSNSAFHHIVPRPEKRRITCSQRDRIDSARVVASATPMKIHTSEFGKDHLRYGDQSESDTVTIQQITHRCKTVDRRTGKHGKGHKSKGGL